MAEGSDIGVLELDDMGEDTVLEVHTEVPMVSEPPVVHLKEKKTQPGECVLEELEASVPSGVKSSTGEWCHSPLTSCTHPAGPTKPPLPSG